jgi:glycosyltransferase involved in cell wall biosynthesis
MRRRVGIVSTWSERGAAYVSRQYRQALQTHHDVFIYARGDGPHPTSSAPADDPRVTRAKEGIVPLSASMDLDDFKAWILRNRIGVALFNEQHWWEPVLLCDRLGITTGAYVVEYREQTVPFYACYDFLVCNTRQHFDTFNWHPGALYVPWGTDLDQFAPKQWTAVRPGWLTFFHSGGMNPRRKGSDLVVEAFSRVRGPARLVLHTQVGLDEALPDAVTRVRELVESGRLTLIEETVADRAALYRLGDVCVYPSRFDGLGLTVAEALASGQPVIATNCPPMNEFIDGSSGKLVDVARRVPHLARSCWPQCVVDEHDLTRQMQSYVDDLGRVEELRRAARRYAEKHLDWTRNALALPDFIGSVQRRSTKEQSAAIEQVRAFERRRAAESVRFWLSYYAPRLVKAARTVWRASHRSAASSGTPAE